MSSLSSHTYAQKMFNIVLIHGWGLHSGVWQKNIKELQVFANVILIDRAGYGHSPIMSLEEELQAILAIAPAQAVYIGWSLGASVVWQLASRYPQRVQGIIAVAANPCFVARDDWSHGMSWQAFNQFKESTQSNAYTTLLRFMGLQTQGALSQRQDMRFLQQQLAQQAIPHTQVLLNGLNELAQDYRSLITQLNCPILWVQGAKDILVNVDADALLALNEHIIVNIIADAAHVPFVSHSDLFSDCVMCFVADLP